MWKLESCGIYRDGGSLGASHSDGTKYVSLFLNVQWWDRPPVEMQYKSLWVSEGKIPRNHGEEVFAGSETERKWLWQL